MQACTHGKLQVAPMSCIPAGILVLLKSVEAEPFLHSCILETDWVFCLQLPNQDEVEFWHKAEKSGWLQSQGEHLRTWRRRWFVLKQGFLFRFADQNVVANSKPRGIVDLSKVTNVSGGREATGKNNSITLSTESGSVSRSL